MEKIKKEKKDKLPCASCGKSYVDTSFNSSNSIFFERTGRLPYCKQCIEKFYQYFYLKYKNEGCLSPEKNAIKRLCMICDIYYKEEVFNSAMTRYYEDGFDTSPIKQYMGIIQLWQYNRNKETYEDTLVNERDNGKVKVKEKTKSKENGKTKVKEQEVIIEPIIDIRDEYQPDEDTVNFFGTGFSGEDYKFLKKEYDDWTARHECKTKAQEEVFKDICFNRLQNLKALRAGDDTKDITASFQKLLDSGKLQPKQNAGDSMADNQTFGTLIDKWENTRPLPEIDEELRDVDKIGAYLDVFFKGHLAKMMGMKNGHSRLYSEYMKKYTVEKPEYESDEDSEALFDAIFGSSLDKDEEVVR